MKLEEFSIRRYGPLRDSGKIRLANFTLFWGENEDGKTLTLEALLRLLLGKVRKIFPGMDRVKESPDGYAVIDTHNGAPITLPEQGDITSVCGLPPEVFASLFVIRNSDLSIGRESKFYGDVTERLTGLRTTQLHRIKDRLRALGYFTDGLDTVNTKESNHLKRRIAQAQELLKICEALLVEAKTSGYDSLEETLVDLQIQEQALELEINAIEKARLQMKYQQGVALVGKIREMLRRLESYRQFSEAELNNWQQSLLIIEEKEQERENVQQQFAIYEKELAEEEEKLVEYKQQLQVTRNRKQKVDDVLRPLLQTLQSFRKDYARRNAGKLFIQISLTVFVFLSLGFLIALFGRSSNFLVFGASLSSTVSLFLALIYFYRIVKPRGELHQLETEVVHHAGDLGLKAKTVPQVQEQMSRLEESLMVQQEKVSSSEGRVAFLASTCKSLQEERLAEINKRIRDAREEIYRIQTKQDLDDMAAYRRKLQERRQLEQEMNEAMAVLRSLFGSRGGDVAENLTYWEEELALLSDYRDAHSPVRFDEKLLEARKKDYHELTEKIEETREKLKALAEQLLEIERKASEVLLSEEAPLCRNLSDLGRLQEHLLSFLENIETRQRQVRFAMDIFDEIELEEKQKVGDLFGRNSLTSRLYENITRGLYIGVFYDPEEGTIRVERKDGKVLSPEKLSGGAYDQLYFAIRLALAEKLLPAEKGFFILDDPFLKSDRERLQRQMEMLTESAARGWQIIYFSAKDEVKEVLEPYIRNGTVSLQHVSGVVFKAESV